MRRTALILGVLFSVPCLAAVNVPLTVQEAIYPGSVAGVARSADPVSVGIPLPDDPNGGATDTSELTLTGASAGQFRIVGRWPSGRIKWVLVDTLATLGAGQRNTSMALTSGGSGNFGGADLAVDNGASITVDTGAAQFTVRKANFNVIDQVTIGSTNVLASGASKGLIVYGPVPGQTTCPPCTTEYASANDGSSTAVIEENGPVKTVIRASGAHVDGSGNTYMRFTVRMYFYRGKTHVKLTSVLRNADYGGSNSFASAYKGHEGYELQISPAISGQANYSIGNHTSSPTTGNLASSDKVYLYQGESQHLKGQDWCGFGCVPYSPDTGYSIVRNGSPVVSGNNTQAPQGWADVSGAGGTGVEIGVYQLAAHWPKALIIDSGGTDVRIGIWARESSRPYYQSWPQWSIHELFLNFHAAPLASASADFLRYQHYLLGRASYTHYNNTKVFPYPLVDPGVEDAYYTRTATGANPNSLSVSRGCCIQDLGTSNTFQWPLQVTRFYAWGAGGGANQSEFRWSHLLNFLTRGMPGRYLQAAHFYRFLAEQFLPHSDGFDWRTRPAELDGFGLPSATPANASQSFRNWRDQEHGHWYGMPDYYFMTGDETIREAMNDQAKDWYLNNRTYQAGILGGLAGAVNTSGTSVTRVSGSAFSPNLVNGSISINGVPYPVVSVTNGSALVLGTSAGNQSGVSYFALGGLWNTRSIGIQMMSAARYAQFLAATGDPDAEGVLNQGKLSYAMMAKPDLCVSGYPAGCAIGAVDGGPWNTVGVSRTRGLAWGPQGTGSELCGVSPHNYRVQSAFQGSIFIQGLLELREAAGLGWSDYWTALDLAYGVARFNLSEMFVDDGSGRWSVNGFRYGIALDRDHLCTGSGERPDGNFFPQAQQTINMTFLAKYLVDGGREWEQKFRINLQKDMAALGISTSDFGSYQLGALISILNGPAAPILQDVPISSFAAAGSGSYTISWVVPDGTSGYRIKWGEKRIVDWIGFDTQANAFTGDPVNTMPWFAARHVDAPAPLAGGSTQTLTIAAGVDGLTAANFSVRAYVSSGGAPPVAANLSSVSGSGQSGAPGTVLAAPFSVKVTAAGGSPVAGVTVSFAVTAGGGSLSQAQAVTDSLGLASSTLTLGPAPGVNTVTASSGSLAGSPVTFSATGTAPVTVAPATSIAAVSGSGQSASAGQAVASPLVVRVTDANGQPVSGVAVSFRVTSGTATVSSPDTVTDGQGLASTSVTLGSGAGSVAISATSGSLAGSPVVFTLTITAPAATASGSVVWSQRTRTSTFPGWVGWHQPVYDPVSKQVIFYMSPSNYAGIYSTGLFFYDTAANTFTMVGNTGSLMNQCPANTPTQPGDRHPVGQIAIDTKRNFLWIYGGANQLCGLDNPRQDMFYMTLNPDPTQNMWRQATFTTFPRAAIASSMAYDPDNDVLFAFGSDIGSQTHGNWIYCRTAENPTPGTPTPAQRAAGCTRGDDWNEIAVQGGVQPAGVNFPSMYYDTATKRMILYGGEGRGNRNETWSYNVTAKTWTRKALSTTPPPVFPLDLGGPLPVAYDPVNAKLYFHQSHSAGAPADWVYDPVTDQWAKLNSTGGTRGYTFMAYDAKVNALVGVTAGGNGAEIFVGALSGTSSGGAPVNNVCDLNKDGTVNVLDVQAAVRQATGDVPCSNGDINIDRVCTSADVDRVITAALGGACATTP